MIVLKTSDGAYFKRIGSVQGQPAAIECLSLDDARKFRTDAAAEKFLRKWLGTGVGMERFRKEIEMPRTNASLHEKREASRTAELTERGAVLERREDVHGHIRKGWWLDDVFLGGDTRTALEAIRG